MKPWVTATNPPVFDEWHRQDFGAAKTFDRVIIATPQAFISGSIRNGKVQYSTDDVVWSDAATITDLYGAQPTVHKFVEVSFTAQTARYWRILISSQWAANFTGSNEIVFWNSADIGGRLDNGAGFVITATGSSTASAAELADRDFSTYGLYWARAATNDIAGLDIDLGSVQYIGGLSVISYEYTSYWPTSIDVLTSTDGSTWTRREKTTAAAWVDGTLYSIAFSRIYSTRYVRLIPRTDSGGLVWFEWLIYATLTPAAPPDPTSVTARASDTGTDIEVTWSEAAGDDNVVADLEYKVERQKDGGGWSTLTSTHPVTHYVDTSLAAGDYDYRVTAINKYHARESSAVQTGASVTSPAAAGGGAPRSAFAGAGMRVS